MGAVVLGDYQELAGGRVRCTGKVLEVPGGLLKAESLMLGI